ncbi:anion permease [Roseococcus sp. SDR]|uniref:anion permease n=1 Tax=Roseococcus sp. SDR TaxID=2835532 RepID=UPI001BCB3DE3|nr:anion permease [Roseococcus sp. SDR]MBS7789798.1 hypothetical protein [Roseococcus sp. SDR]MBV1845112.1 anion permease [Roseococcus sp. SDR]
MATVKQLRAIFAPVLAQHPDLVLHKRWLIRPPIETAIIGLYIEPLSAPCSSRMALSVIPLSRFEPSWVLGYSLPFEVERIIGAEPPGRLLPNWRQLPPRTFEDMFAPEYEAQLVRNFNAKVPAFFDAVRSFEDVVAWLQPFRAPPLRTGFPDRIDAWVACMRGEFAKASGLLSDISKAVRPSDARSADRIEQEDAELQSILRSNDAPVIAAHLHAMEEATIAAHGLQRHWRRTPFPFER